MTDKETVRKFFLDGYVNQNFERLHEIMAEDYLDHSPCHATSCDECIAALRNTAEGFRDMEIEIRDMIEEDRKVAARIYFSCIHTGGYSIPATGNRVGFEALEIFRLEDGLIVESWGYWPNTAIVRQIEV